MKINSYTFSPSKCSLSQLETFLCYFYVQLLFSFYFFYLTCNNSKLKHVWQNHILRDAKLSIAKRHYKENNNTEFFLCQTHLVIQYFKHNEFSTFDMFGVLEFWCHFWEENHQIEIWSNKEFHLFVFGLLIIPLQKFTFIIK